MKIWFSGGKHPNYNIFGILICYYSPSKTEDGFLIRTKKYQIELTFKGWYCDWVENKLEIDSPSINVGIFKK